MSDPILRALEGGAVKRCHVIPHHGHYDVAQHTWRMLVILDILYPTASPELRRAILWHDVGERWTGDTPTVAKQICKRLKAAVAAATEAAEKAAEIPHPVLTVSEADWLKALDWLEFLIWCDDQISMGNVGLSEKRQTVWDGIWLLPMPAEIADYLRSYKWKRCADDLS